MIYKPTIGISASLLTIETGSFVGRERSYVGYDYVLAIEKAGGIPILLPIVAGEEAIQRHESLIDGLVLSGGHDVNPRFYGEEPEEGLGAVLHARDVYEMGIARAIHAANKPLLGICRGLQVMNVVFGGSLYQDIPLALPDALQHSQPTSPEDASQLVDVVEGTVLHRIIGQTEVLTNTYHHQAIKQLAPGFIACARAKDGIIEGIEKMGDPLTLGVQWHPELMFHKHLPMLRLFQALVEVASKNRRLQ